MATVSMVSVLPYSSSNLTWETLQSSATIFLKVALFILLLLSVICLHYVTLMYYFPVHLHYSTHLLQLKRKHDLCPVMLLHT